MYIYQYIKKFLKNNVGQVSVIAGIAAIPLIGAVGLGIDFSMLASTKAQLQNNADVEALERRGGRWISDTVYQVDKEKTVGTYFMGVLGQYYATVRVSAQATLRDPAVSFDPASVIPIVSDAADYNITGFYCYNPETNERHTYTDMADNRRNKFVAQKTTCNPGEEVEFYLKNWTYTSNDSEGAARNFLENPCSSSSASDECEVTFFFTDRGDKSSIMFPGAKIKNAAVETILCDPLSQCFRPTCYVDQSVSCLNYKSEGGKIPTGEYRKPLNEKQMCEPGKFIYFGWEDTPEKRAVWDGDFDYNDYTVIAACPSLNAKDGKVVYLIK